METTFFSKAMMGAIALCGTVAFTACSSSDNPDVDPIGSESVKTQFSISLPANVAGKTRASVETVQGQTTPVFRGMKGITLVPYGVSPVTETSTRLGDNISLGDIATTELGAKSNAKLYKDVNVPIGTTGFLFYGKANDGTVTTATDKFKFGTLNESALTGENSTFTFTPEPIFAAGTADAKATAIATYLTTIATATDGTTAWSATTNAGLKDLYDKFITMAAGSSTSVLAAVQSLYNSLKPNADNLSKAIRTAIANTTYVSVAGETLTLQDAVAGYPKNINLPDGAAVVKWSTDKFVADPEATQTYKGLQIGVLKNYVYMPNLYYTVNTDVKTMTGDQEPLYNTTNTWEQILNGYTSPSTAVTSTTRSVALVKPVQYAVGRLNTVVKIEPSADGKYYDNLGEEVTVTDTSFPITGVLIGGQKAVGFDFTPKAGEKEVTVYDNAVTGATATAVGSAVNYTLALETSDNIEVNIAIELENNTGKDFQGATGIIPAGSKFYLIAKLEPAKGTGATDVHKVFKQDYITTANLTIKGGNKTTGVPGFTNPIGLGNAYNVIPDLRTPKLSLGLSVDLTWQSGLTFNVDL